MIRLYLAMGLLKSARYIRTVADSMVEIARRIVAAAAARAHEKAQ